MAKTFKGVVYKRNDDGTYRGCGQFAVLTEESVKKAVKKNDNLKFSDIENDGKVESAYE